MRCVLPMIMNSREALLSKIKVYLNMTSDVLLCYIKFSCFLGLCMRSFPADNSSLCKIVTIPCGIRQQQRFSQNYWESTVINCNMCTQADRADNKKILMNVTNCVLTL